MIVVVACIHAHAHAHARNRAQVLEDRSHTSEVRGQRESSFASSYSLSVIRHGESVLWRIGYRESGKRIAGKA